MNILGTIYMVDEPHIDVLKQTLLNSPPPGAGTFAGSVLCVDLDETDNMLELWFPNHAQKATLLCPPPRAMYFEIDGDSEGFIEAYNDYLDHDDSVQDFIATMLLYMHKGGNIIMYVPAQLTDDAIWINVLTLFFFTRYGITIGTSATEIAQYDPRYDSAIADFLYERGYMEVFDYMNSSTSLYISKKIQDRLYMDLMPYTGPGENPMDVYATIKYYINTNGAPIYKPGIIFNR